MIRFPRFAEGAVIGVTAPSSGLELELHDLLSQSAERMKERGFDVVLGETAWTQDKAKSAPALKRALEFNGMMRSEETDVVIPPWGGELLIEILDRVEYDQLKEKWILGYSDISVLLLAVTLKTGIATAHGTNLIDLRGEYSDETTAMWQRVLSTRTGETVIQYSSARYQKEWKHDDPAPCIFHLTEETNWKTVSGRSEKIEGRLLGGCVDVIRHLVGTPYGDVGGFRNKHIPGEPILWYFENCELHTTDLRRSLVQMKLAGWFDHCSGIMFGRSSANKPVGNYTVEDVYKDLSDELQVPVIYDIDCGHVPPQVTLINGAFALVEAADGKGKIAQHFRP